MCIIVPNFVPISQTVAEMWQILETGRRAMPIFYCFEWLNAESELYFVSLT